MLDKSYKARVTHEQSRQIQELVFELGGSWADRSKEVKNQNRKYLHIDTQLELMFNSLKGDFLHDDDSEITATELIAMLEKLVAEQVENNEPKEDKTMELDDFLKVRKVRAVNNCHKGLKPQKVYTILGVNTSFITVCNENGRKDGYPFCNFEPVLDEPKPVPEIDTTQNSVDEPKFKVGDPVFMPMYTRKIVKITEQDSCSLRIETNNDDHSVSLAGRYNSRSITPAIFHATPENHALLSKIYPHIEFEQPPKELTGDELVKAILEKGIKNVLCLWGNGDKIIIDRLDYKGSLMSADCRVVGGLTPIDWHTGELLTQAVLDE